MKETQGKETPGTKQRQRRYTAKAQQLKHLRAWECSGLSGAQYAREHGLLPRDLYRWGKLRGKGTGSEQAPKARPSPSSGRFMTIDVSGAAAGSSCRLCIVLRHGPLEVEVSGGASADELARLAGVLRREVLDA